MTYSRSININRDSSNISISIIAAAVAVDLVLHTSVLYIKKWTKIVLEVH